MTDTLIVVCIAVPALAFCLALVQLLLNRPPRIRPNRRRGRRPVRWYGAKLDGPAVRGFWERMGVRA